MPPRADLQAKPPSGHRGCYTIRDALDEADELLRAKYAADPDQLAVVHLATFLFGAHARDEFLREHEHDDTSYGTPG